MSIAGVIWIGTQNDPNRLGPGMGRFTAYKERENQLGLKLTNPSAQLRVARCWDGAAVSLSQCLTKVRNTSERLSG
jgi:hypothetical protein